MTVKDGEKALVEGTDYAETYENNTAVGTATVTITGKGNYAGERTINFTIAQRDIAEDKGFTIDPIPDQVYTGGEIEPEITVKDGDKVLVEGEDYEVTFEENTDAGTVTVTITGTGNYAGETEVTFEIVKADRPGHRVAGSDGRPHLWPDGRGDPALGHGGRPRRVRLEAPGLRAGRGRVPAAAGLYAR